MRSLVDIVTKDNVIDDSEYMETILVAVPRYFISSPLADLDLMHRTRETEPLLKTGTRSTSD